MSKCVRIDPATLPEQERQRMLSLVASPQPVPTCGSRCVACNRLLEEVDMSIVGYASGEALGTCRKCASTINTPEAIMAAQLKGHEVKSKPIYPPPSKPGKKGDDSMDEWEGE